MLAKSSFSVPIFQLAGVILTIAVTFSAAARAQTETVLYAFTGNTGYAPEASLIFDRAGNLYGTTSGGGANGNGAVFELSPDGGGSWTEKVLYSFALFNDGIGPVGPLIFDTSGNLYGTTAGGGLGLGCYNCGTVFMLTPAGSGQWTETILHSFNGGGDAESPYGGLTFDKAGNLYGTGYYGGSVGVGAVFELAPSSSGWIESVLYSFTGTPDGASPYGGLKSDDQGNLFGTTGAGGTFNAGTVYELTLSKHLGIETVIHSFGSGNDGAVPIGVVTFDKQGRIYGTTYEGGVHGDGTVYQLTRQGAAWRESARYNFQGGRDGSNPFFGNLSFDKAGRLFGTTNQGGVASLGTVFVIAQTKTGAAEKIIHTFTGGSDGASPYAGVTIDTIGNLYGTSAGGGNTCFDGCGTVFQIVP